MRQYSGNIHDFVENDGRRNEKVINASLNSTKTEDSSPYHLIHPIRHQPNIEQLNV
jgi:hypothetical protein